MDNAAVQHDVFQSYSIVYSLNEAPTSHLLKKVPHIIHHHSIQLAYVPSMIPSPTPHPFMHDGGMFELFTETTIHQFDIGMQPPSPLV